MANVGGVHAPFGGLTAFTFLSTFHHPSHFVLFFHCTTTACQEMVAEMRASFAYDTTTLLVGDADECRDFLEGLADRVEGEGEICADVPAEAFEDNPRESDDPDITMYGTTSLPSFLSLFGRYRSIPSCKYSTNTLALPSVALHTKRLAILLWLGRKDFSCARA